MDRPSIPALKMLVDVANDAKAAPEEGRGKR
jgi:hypothetical protein